MRKAQAGAEMVIIVAVAVIVLISIVAIHQQITQRNNCQSAVGLAQAAIDIIANAAEAIHNQAVGSRTNVFVQMPAELASVAIFNRTVHFTVMCGNNSREVYRGFGFNVSGNLPPIGGGMLVFVESKLPYVLITTNATNISYGPQLCLNGIRELGEQCDLGAHSNQTCVTLGYRGGELQCAADCTWDFSTCTPDDPPNVVMSAPGNGVALLDSLFSLNCSASDDFNLSSVEIWTNLSGSWSVTHNCTLASNVSSQNCSAGVNLDYGWMSWSCRAVDDIGQITWGQNFTVMSTDDLPNVTLGTPMDGWTSYGSRGLVMTTLLTMSEIEPQWQAEALIGSMVNWLMTSTGKCTCGTDLGACRQSTQQCVGGAWGLCEGIPPINELCNGIDDDCDSYVDENIQCNCTNGTIEVCGTNVGQCSLGNRTCDAESWGSCEGDIGPDEELCDGIDNDCDGAIDDIDSESCGISNIGECALGTQHCVGGDWGSCEGAVLPSQEVCDGLDNDCDGLTDEVNCACTSGAQRACPTLCGSGIQNCESGYWGDCTEITGPQPEICDGLDNNCDGRVDEGLSRPCGCDCADTKVLMVLDGNHHGEDIGDVNYTIEMFDRQDINYTLINEPYGGLRVNDTEGYDLIWFVNPGWPMDTRVTLQTLSELFNRNVPIVLHGDDMTWGMTELAKTDLEPLTHLHNVNNGLDTNYTVIFSNGSHPVLTYLAGREFTYKEDDIDTNYAVDDDVTVLATGSADINPAYGGPAIAVRDESDFVNVTLMCTATSPKIVQRIEIWTNISGAFNITSSCEVNSTSGNCTVSIPMGFGTIHWNCYATDITGAGSFASTNWTIIRASEDSRNYALVMARRGGSNGHIAALGLDNGTEIWRINATNYPDSIGIGDVTYDGYDEIFYAKNGTSNIFAARPDGSAWWTKNISGDSIMSVLNPVNDRYLFWSSNLGRAYITNTTNVEDVVYADGPFPGSDGAFRVIALGNTDGDEYPDIFGTDPKSGRGYLRAWHGDDGSLDWSINIGNSADFTANRLLVYDFNNDGYDDVAFGAQDDRVYVRRGESGNALWNTGTIGGDVHLVTLGNFTADSRSDIVALTNGGSSIYVFNGNGGAQVFTHSVAGGARDVLETADIDHDGYTEIIYGNYTAKKITVIDGKTRNKLWSSDAFSNYLESATVWDVNNDFTPDIVATDKSGNIKAISGVNGTTIWSVDNDGIVTTKMCIARINYGS